MSLFTPRPATADAGVSSVVVIVSFFLVIAMTATTATYVANATRRTRHEQDSGRAIRAAESGIHDLLTRLRMNPDYMTIPADEEGSFCANPATSTPEPIDFVADLCGWDSNTGVGWTSADGNTAATFGEPHYHYEIVEIDLERKSILVDSTGRSSTAADGAESGDLNTVYQTVRARIAVPAPSDYLYWSDFELADPTDRTTYPDNEAYPKDQNTSAMCGAGWSANAASADLGYGWQTDLPARTYLFKGKPVQCRQPGFTAKDVLEGPVHSNDMIRANGATFRGKFTTAYQGCSPSNPDYPKSCLDPAGAKATFDWKSVGAPQPSIASQWTPREFVEVINIGDKAKSEGIGCHYQGATRIVLDKQNMRVWSAGTTKPTCNENLAALNNPTGPGAVVPIPQDGLVYVANTSQDSSAQIEPGQIGDGLPNGSTTSNKRTYEAAMAYPEKAAGRANVYIEGSLTGQLTVASQEGIVITGDVLVEDPEQDMLGLSAGTVVEIYNPLMVGEEWFTHDGEVYTVPVSSFIQQGWPKQYAPTAEMSQHCDANDLTVAAAIFAADGSFRVQNWDAGGVRGNLCVFGSVAQRFRGVVALEDGAGKVTAGYSKHYIYDPRYRRERPPHTAFLGDWLAIDWTEERPTADHIWEAQS